MYNTRISIFSLMFAMLSLNVSMASEKAIVQSNSEQIDQLLSQAEKEPKNQKIHWQQAAALNSGFAHSKLAELTLKESPHQKDKIIYHYAQAAQFGYPECYQNIADMLKSRSMTQQDLLMQCYLNVAEVAPKNALLHYCQTELAGTFRYSHNQGIQSNWEALKKAKHDVASFCRDPNAARWIHPDISQLERHALFSLLCQEASKTQSALNIGDVVLQDDKLLQMTDTGLQPYLPSLHDGDVVYRLNPPISLLLYDNGQLKVANNGDTVIKDNQAFVVENNQLVKR